MTKLKKGFLTFLTIFFIGFLLGHYLGFAGGYPWGSQDFLEVLSMTMFPTIIIAIVAYINVAEAK